MSESGPTIGLALSGGGSRAIAFHLGSMKALHDLGILEKVRVVSTVSGGSVIGALWAFSDEPFPDFEKRIREHLRSGLASGACLQFGTPRFLARWLPTVLIALPINLLLIPARIVLSWIGGSKKRLHALRWPVLRWASRTYALELYLDHLFGGRALLSATRDGVHVVINACELQTGTAFRFGNNAVANYIFGRAPASSVRISTAVAASAAFPLLLPALDVKLELDGKQTRVLLTDGGVYDNLGVTVFAGDRDPRVSEHVFNVSYVLCSSAGQGRPEHSSISYWWVPRMMSVAMTQFRKLQDSGYARLHLEKDAARIQGFALAYLGQNDSKLGELPIDWIPRERVIDYGTNFSKMSDDDAEALIRRGYGVMRKVVEMHCPDIVQPYT